MSGKLSPAAASVLIDAGEPLSVAMRRLCETARQTLFVAECGKLVAALTDGDIRRFLLGGGALTAAVSDAANWKPKFVFSSERRKAESFLREKGIAAVPVVDENMVLEDVVFQRETVDLSGVVLRELVHADLEMVLEFFDQMAGDTRAMFNRNDVNRIRVMEHLNREGDDGQVHFAATVRDADGSEKMVGYVFLWDVDTLIPWLGIAVREDWKGHHLGRRLLEHADGYLRPKGYGGVMLTSVPANVRAHALYERMGFSYHGAYPDGEFLYIKRYERA